MANQNQIPDSDALFPTEIEQLRIKNILLEQKVDLDEQFGKHKESVQKQIDSGKLKLGFAGFLVLCVAWYGTYKELGTRVQRRLDQEFETKEIKSLITKSATLATQKLIDKKLTEFSNLEHSQLKCANEKSAKGLFALKCQVAGGNFDEERSVCFGKAGEETYYEPTFPNINCDKVAEASAAARPQPAHE